MKHTGLLALLLAAAIAVTAAGCKDKGGKEEPQDHLCAHLLEPDRIRLCERCGGENNIG